MMCFDVLGRFALGTKKPNLATVVEACATGYSIRSVTVCCQHLRSELGAQPLEPCKAHAKKKACDCCIWHGVWL